MKRVDRHISIVWKNNPSMYQRANKAIFYPTILNLTPTVNAVKSMLACSSELAVIMPTVLGKSSKDEGWQQSVSDWFNGLCVGISEAGIDLNISYNFNYEKDTPVFKTHLKEYLERKSIDIDAILKITNIEKREDEILKYITGENGASFKCEESELYKLVEFEDPTQYLYYRFALVSSLVANSSALADKSNKIRFVITSNETTIAEQNAAYRKNQDALAKYMEISSKDKAYIDDILISFELITSHEQLKRLTSEQKAMLIQQLAITDADRFLKLYKQPNHDKRAFVEKMIWFNVLTRIEDTQAIVDASDTSKIIGNTMDEAISFIANKINAGYVEVLKTKFKSLN